MLKKEYKISVNQEDWVTPEETLLDSSSEYSDIEKPIASAVFNYIFIGIMIFAGIIFSMTVKLSVIDHEQFAALSIQNSTANFFVPPPRGLIFDRNDVALIKNTPSFDLLVVSREIKEKDSETEQNISKISQILGAQEVDLKKSIFEQMENNSIFFIAKDISKDQLLAMNFLSPKGFYIIPTMKRGYIDGHQFSQIIGYIGKVNKEDLRDAYYKHTDIVGKLGLEAQYENYLRGEHGKIYFSREDMRGENVDPVSGRNLTTSIEFNLQKKLYSELFEILRSAGLDKAAAVIQNPKTGEVLALASFPSFDNNIFNEGLSEKEFDKLFKNTSRPLFNRVSSGLYNPGSTIKPFFGMAILEEKIFNPTDNIRDCVSLVLPNPYDPDSPAVFNNWREDFGLFNLKRAIANSCNVYFYIGGGGYKNIKGLGVDNIFKYLHLSLADNKLGLDIPGEEAGFIPTQNWKMREKGEAWYQGDTYNISIGQGDLLVTPLWINSYVSAVANGGTIYKPYIVQKVTDQNKNIIAEFGSQELTKLPFEKENIEIVKNAMEETILSGTAQIFKD
ncbi:MAG: hypothetical protein A3J46_00475, partial [Candidatus Yanofskybacteria bacterium RIFCSPHIGHO2_02_FULL_41_11]